MQNFVSGKGPKKFSYTSRKEKIRLRLIDEEGETPENPDFPEFSGTDVLGSYTGRPKDKKEKPVQDADDL